MNAAHPAGLDAWLAYIQHIHCRPIEMGRERISRVAALMGATRPAHQHVLVAGTNGKGSCCAILESVHRAQGYSSACYLSPHLRHFRERLRIDGRMVSEADWCGAFQRVEQARGCTSLTYFEFITLAALDLCRRRGVHTGILEVGLGGRLDAVNVIDGEVAVITSIDLDHQQWLGTDRDSIGYEKAGIMRPGRPVVCGERRPPDSLLRHADALQAPLLQIGRDFDYRVRGAHSWDWWGRDRHDAPQTYEALPLPALPVENAACALQALHLLPEEPSREALQQGLEEARLEGRYQKIQLEGGAQLVLDVAHNPAGARWLARRLESEPLPGACRALFATLPQKDYAGMIEALQPVVDEWWPAQLEQGSGLHPQALLECLRRCGAQTGCVTPLRASFQKLRQRAEPGERILVCGSFHTVAEVLPCLPPACLN